MAEITAEETTQEILAEEGLISETPSEATTEPSTPSSTSDLTEETLTEPTAVSEALAETVDKIEEALPGEEKPRPRRLWI